ncbi:MAG: OPT/YSL family transporter [Bacteroidia bacterium]|nr:OPT/YSL family transporter [Bacteroidia bacterium]
MNEKKIFKPYISATDSMPEFTLKAILLGACFGVIFGAATVYLALRAGLSVSASIPIAVLSISIGRKFFKTTILENNIIQTTGSASESIASGVVFTLPGFLFLSVVDGQSVGISYFNYWTILTLAILGGMLGTFMMIPLRRSLIVKEHGVLPFPEGTACASVLIAGDKGGNFAKTAYMGLGVAFVYAALQKVFHVITDLPSVATAQANKFFPSAKVESEITPEYLGVGYIIGPKIACELVAGGILAWLVLNPLLASIIPMETIAMQLVKLGKLADLNTAGGAGNWDPVTKTFADTADALYTAYIKQIGAGAVAAGGFITLLKTIPTIVSSFKESMASMKSGNDNKQTARTENDLSFKVVLIGCAVLMFLVMVMPQIPGDSFLNKLLLGLLVVVFGFFFVTVSSRIVGIIGGSSSPISGMTIATIMGTSLIFISVGWTGVYYEPMALVVGSMICIAAANAGATSQDLKTGYIIGATPRYQQLALFIGAIVASVVIGLTVKLLDTPTPEMQAQGIEHAIGTKGFSAPQATLMATLIKGLLSYNLDWSFILVGIFLSITMELCGVKSLSFAVGAYLPLSTTLPIFAGGVLKAAVDYKQRKSGVTEEDAELGRGSLFATGLVAGGALAGVLVALLWVIPSVRETMTAVDFSEGIIASIGKDAFMLLGIAMFLLMAFILFKVATNKNQSPSH